MSLHTRFNEIPYTRKCDYVYGGPSLLALRDFISSYFHASYEPSSRGWRATLRTPLFGICLGKRAFMDDNVYPGNFVWLGAVPLPFRGHNYYWQEYMIVFRTYKDPLPTPQRVER